MRNITSIIGIEEKRDKFTNNPFYRTHAIAHSEENGSDEVIGWSDGPDEYKVGDEVMVYFHDKWDQGKMSKPKID